MIVACSGEKRVLDVPEEGSAVVAGYWTPELGLVKGPIRIAWHKRKISLLNFANFMAYSEDSREAGYSRQAEYSWLSYILMPGFIDAHVHLALDSIDFYQCLANWQEPLGIEEGIKGFLRRYLENGIVAIRDGGDLPGFAWAAKRGIDSKVWPGPKVVSVREAVAREGMYGRFLGRGFKSIQDWLQVEEEFFNQGADQLKVIVTGIIRFDHYGQVGPVQWTVEELKELVHSAHQRRVRVMAHASGEEGIARAIEAGVDSIEHGYYITSEQLRKMKVKNIAWVPTVAPIGNLLKYPSGRYSEHEISNLSRILEGHLNSIQEAFFTGVPLGIGTDAGAYSVSHGDSFPDELAWMGEAGIPQEEVYRLATRENARICGLTEYGRVEVGIPLGCLQLVPESTFLYCGA